MRRGKGRTAAWVVVALLLMGIGSWAKGPGPKRSTRESVVFLSSSYLEVAIDDVYGQFTMGVPDGPILLYGHPDPWSSFTTVRVDGQDYDNRQLTGDSFGDELQPPLTVGDSNEGVWQIGATALRVHQIMTLVTGVSTGHQDTCLVQYKIDNLDSVAHVVGCRIMFDTDLDDNDGAPFRVPGTGSVTTETQWDGGNIPPNFFVFNDLNNPSVTAQATLLGGVAVPTPGRLQIAAWPTIYDSNFDYTVTPGEPVTDDSAYAVYWQNYSLAPGQSITFSTYYGLGGIAVDTNPPLVTSVSAPVTMDCQSGTLTPNPFDITLYAANSSPGVTSTVTGIHAQLTLPQGLTLLSGSATQTLPDLAPGEDGLLDWTVAADGSQTGSRPYSIVLASDNAGTKTLSGAVNVPAGCSACFIDLTASASPSSGGMPLAVAFAAQGTPTNCSGSVAYDWDFGDGSTHASAQNPAHTYTDPGTYTWTVTASIGAAVTSKSGTITVRSAPPPVVSNIRKAGSPFRFIVAGSNFQSGITVTINGAPWSNAVRKSDSKIVIKGGSALKALVPKGTPSTFVFTNPDGGSATVTGWSW
jgi:PKD repeat protein